jgi:hypothetical protein
MVESKMNKMQKALKLALEALEETRNALAWFYDSYPEDVTPKGNELLPHVEVVLADLRQALAVAEPHKQQPACKQALQVEQQPADEPVAYQTIGEANVELGSYSDVASNGQQRKLVGKVEMGQLVGDRAHKSASHSDAEREIAVIAGVDEHGPMLEWRVHWINYPAGTKLYTRPQTIVERAEEAFDAAKQRGWVGLTEEEMRDLEKQFNAERVRTSDEEYLVIYPGDYWAWQRAIEAKLREKNQ